MRTGLRGIGRLVVLLCAVAGLFAMHGLGDHGTMAADDHAAMATMAPVHVAPVSSEAAPAHHDGPGMGTMTTCVAVLAGLLLLGLAARRRTPLPARSAPRGVRTVRPVSHDRAPPDLTLLQVSRC